MRRDSAWKRHFYEDLWSNNTDEKYSSEQHQFCDLRCSPEITDGIDGDCRDALKNVAFHGIAVVPFFCTHDPNSCLKKVGTK